MSLAEARELAKRMSYRDAVTNCLRAKCIPYRQATKLKLKEMLELADKLDKYAWHDLRKNPDDLPSEEGEVLVILDGIIGNVKFEKGIELGYYMPTDKSFLGGMANGIVIAWRAIEPFEEVEE